MFGVRAESSFFRFINSCNCLVHALIISADSRFFCLIDRSHCLFFTLGDSFFDISLDLNACGFRNPGCSESVILLVIDHVTGGKCLIQHSIHCIFLDKSGFSQPCIYKNFRGYRSSRDKFSDLIADEPHILLDLIEFLERAVQLQHNKHADYEIRKIGNNQNQYDPYSDCCRQELNSCSVNEWVRKFDEKYYSETPDEGKL